MSVIPVIPRQDPNEMAHCAQNNKTVKDLVRSNPVIEHTRYPSFREFGLCYVNSEHQMK